MQGTSKKKADTELGLLFSPKLRVLENPSEPVGRDSHLDTKPSILENRPTNMIQFAQGLWTIGLNMLATSNLRYFQ